MTTSNSTPDNWLAREDSTCREGRLARLSWLANKTPTKEYWLFPGGLTSKLLFEEARYCFVYGQYLATIVLGLSYIEHTLAGLFLAAGRSDLERGTISNLLQEALNYNWISQTEHGHLQNARLIRNAVTHFRRPGHSESVEYRAVTQNEPPVVIVEDDARYVMETALHLLGNTGV